MTQRQPKEYIDGYIDVNDTHEFPGDYGTEWNISMRVTRARHTQKTGNLRLISR